MACGDELLSGSVTVRFAGASVYRTTNAKCSCADLYRLVCIEIASVAVGLASSVRRSISGVAGVANTSIVSWTTRDPRKIR